MTYILKNKNISISDEELEDLIRQRDSRPKIGDKFWRITTQGEIMVGEYNGKPHHQSILEVGNFFSSEEEAKKEVARRKALVKIRQFCKAQGISLNSGVYSIICHLKGDFLTIVNGTVYKHFLFSFETQEDARLVLDNCLAELRTLFLT